MRIMTISRATLWAGVCPDDYHDDLLHLHQQAVHGPPARLHLATLDVDHLGSGEDGRGAVGVRPARGDEVGVREGGGGAELGRQLAHLLRSLLPSTCWL